ncbi:5-methylthioadenosine/S-adenosylhomocysteine deaminase [Ancylobacter aquaticus]|uniref:5-methylthioadenosine/S-adenosylhomocysteine deaminase n=1 Tax=Ancylobacter aquaticus TaxID=100 RepID=A0A4V6NDN6_ANCAQ|nr:amidohydrolase family protein [Ancylobacter aquaticus]TCK30386.1 5-methylthioadenosine/S-adenosylhomocysteine deaminase [Ancylobacter aquaticus]
MSTLFRGVHLLELDGTRGMSPATDVLVEGDRITAVGVDAAPRAPDDARLIEGHGKLLMPGLINAHFHSSVNHMKGRLDSLPLEIFMLYESPALEALRPTPREAYVRTQLACAEMLKTGVTSVQDDAFFVPEPTTDILDAVMQAYADSGIRATLALDEPELPELDKLPFLKELLPPDLRVELARPRAFGARSLLGMYHHLITRWHGAEGGRLRAAVSCSAPQRVSTEYFHALDDLSRTHGLPFYAHILETKLQRVLGHERFNGRSLVRYVADLGLLSARMNIIHAIWVDEDDLDLIAASGAVIAHNPISNLRLGSGVMPFRAIRRRGIPICLGTDESIADDAVNMWGVAKMAGLIHNITGPDYDSWPRAGEILDCLLRGGARAMGLQDELGSITPGRLADVTLVDLDTLAFTPLNDLHRQLVYCENGGSVVLTMVAGRIVFENGHLTTMDEPALRAEARELFAARAPALHAASKAAERLLPSYRAMYAKASALDVGMNRWLGDADACH